MSVWAEGHIHAFPAAMTTNAIQKLEGPKPPNGPSTKYSSTATRLTTAR